MDFAIVFGLGFVAATAIAIFWFKSTGKEWLDKQKQQVKDRL